MSDSIGSVSSFSASGALRSRHGGGYRQVKADISSLSGALSSGDLSSAKSAFVKLQQDAPALAKESQNAQTGNPRAQAFSDLSSALSGGSISAATLALTKLESAMKGGHGGQVHSTAGASPWSGSVQSSGDSDGDGVGSVAS